MSERNLADSELPSETNREGQETARLTGRGASEADPDFELARKPGDTAVGKVVNVNNPLAKDLIKLQQYARLAEISDNSMLNQAEMSL